MKILFFTYDFPYPTNSGGKMRAYNMMKYAKSGNEITLFSFTREGFAEKTIEHMKSIGIKHVEVFPREKVRSPKNFIVPLTNNSLFKQLYYDPAIAARLKEYVTQENIEIIHFESFYTACYFSTDYAAMGIKQIYGSENIEFKLYEDYVSRKIPALLRPFLKREIAKIKREELYYTAAADMTLAVTEKEKDFFSTHTSHPVRVIENGVSVDEFTYKKRKRKEFMTALFVGNFSYFPNKTAVEFFYENVMKQMGKEIRFQIVGKGSSQFNAWQDDRVETVEFIDDIKDAYYGADVFVCPIAIGGGTNFKILEAMATGLPVVAFSDRVVEIGAHDGKEVLIADSGEDFLQAVKKLMMDEKLGEKLGIGARKIIEDKYSWDAIGNRLKTAWKDVDENH